MGDFLCFALLSNWKLQIIACHARPLTAVCGSFDFVTLVLSGYDIKYRLLAVTIGHEGMMRLIGLFCLRRPIDMTVNSTLFRSC